MSAPHARRQRLRSDAVRVYPFVRPTRAETTGTSSSGPPPRKRPPHARGDNGHYRPSSCAESVSAPHARGQRRHAASTAAGRQVRPTRAGTTVVARRAVLAVVRPPPTRGDNGDCQPYAGRLRWSAPDARDNGMSWLEFSTRVTSAPRVRGQRPSSAGSDHAEGVRSACVGATGLTEPNRSSSRRLFRAWGQRVNAVRHPLPGVRV